MRTNPKKTKIWTPGRFAYYFLAATLPPFMIGVLLTFVILKDLLIPRAPEPMSESAAASIPAVPDRYSRPVALIAFGAGGVQSTEVLASAAVLAASGEFEVVTAAPRRELIRTTSGVEFYPNAVIADAPTPEILVVPSWIGEPNPIEMSNLKKLADQARWVLAIGDGARVLASAGYLADRQATSHPAGRQSLESTYPNVRWVWDRRVVVDGKWMTSDGVFQAISGSLEALKMAASPKSAQETARKIGWNAEQSRAPLGEGSVGWSDWLPMILHGGYGWGRQARGIALFDGIMDLELAVATEAAPRTLSVLTVILSPERRLHRTNSGLYVAPNIRFADSPGLDALVVPRTSLSPLPSIEPLHAASVVSYPEGVTHQLNFDFNGLSEQEGAWITNFVARMTRYPWNEGSWLSGRIPRLLLRVLFLSLVGITLAGFMERKVQAKYTRVR